MDEHVTEGNEDETAEELRAAPARSEARADGLLRRLREWTAAALRCESERITLRYAAADALRDALDARGELPEGMATLAVELFPEAPAAVLAAAGHSAQASAASSSSSAAA